MLVKSTSKGTIAEPLFVFISDSITVLPMTTKTITAFVDLLSEWNTTDTVTPVEKFTEAANLIISQSLPTINDRKIAPIQRNHRIRSKKTHKLPTSP